MVLRVKQSKDKTLQEKAGKPVDARIDYTKGIANPIPSNTSKSLLKGKKK